MGTPGSRLSSAESRLCRKVVECSADGVIAYDVNYRVLLWNSAMERYAGKSKEEVLGQNLFALFPFLREIGDDRRLAAALRGETVTAEERVSVRPDTGQLGFFTAQYSPLRSASGAVVGGLAVIRESVAAAETRQELRRTEERFRDLFEEAPVAYHEIDRQGIIRRVNRAECELLGFAPAEMLNSHVSDFVSAEEREASQEAVRRKLAGELPLESFRRVYTRRDGAQLVVEVHENYIRDESGLVTGIRSALLDITKRKRAEEESLRAHELLEARVRERTAELARANQRLALEYGVARTLTEARSLEAAADRLIRGICGDLELDLGVLWVVDAQGRWLHASYRLGDSAATLAHPQSGPDSGFAGRIRAAARPEWAAAEVAREFPDMQSGLGFPLLLGKEPAGIIVLLSRKALSTDPELLETAGLIGVQIGQFIERKRAEESLHHSEARFAAFMRHLPGIAFMKDVAGRYVYYNAACENLLGRKPEEFIGRIDDELWPPEIASLYRANDRQVLEGKGPIEILEPVPVPNKAEPQAWLMYKFAILGADGSPEFVGGVGVDVTERNLLEEQLRQSQKMEAIGRLAGGVAHDFNNLLTIISGYGRMVLEDLPPDDRARPRVEEVLNASERAAILTSQLLAFSRRQVVQPRVLALNHVLSNMEKMLRRVIGEHIELATDLKPDLWPVKADAGQIEQIVMNLAVNARDAMREGGTLRISTANTLFTPKPAASEGAHVRLSVSDTGIGMDAEVMSHLYEPFFTTKGSGKGTGLGLSTVYGIVKQNGGEIRVESEKGAGAAFHIYLPRAMEAEDAAAPRKQMHHAHTGTETVLLAEDEPGVRQIAGDVLRSLGYRVLEAADGSEALRLAADESAAIDLLLTDVIMPLMSGRELADQLKRLRPGLRTLFMSGYTDDVIAYRGELGSDAEFLQKPFSPDALAQRIRQVLDRSTGC